MSAPEPNRAGHHAFGQVYPVGASLGGQARLSANKKDQAPAPCDPAQTSRGFEGVNRAEAAIDDAGPARQRRCGRERVGQTRGIGDQPQARQARSTLSCGAYAA